MMRQLVFAGMFLTLLTTTGCKSTYYNTWEKLGWHKRDILVDRVEDARDSQKEAQEQFQTTLERFIAVTKAEVGDLQSRYNKLQSDYDRSEARANDVRKRIKEIEDVAEDLFGEWQTELAQYESAELRRSSEDKLRDTRSRYKQLVAAMRRAEKKMDPVLAAFKDQVLFLKHNLNARAIASLQTTTATLETDVSQLIKEMEQSIAEANEFIKQMQ